jgi:hypothetical protein
MVVEWDLHDCEEAGLVKFDLLRLAALNVISRTVEMIEESDLKHLIRRPPVVTARPAPAAVALTLAPRPREAGGK